jgi:hypothetical protein
MQTSHNAKVHNPLASDAWQMWKKLHKLADFLWVTYEQDFLEFCYQEVADHESAVPPENNLPF